MALWESVQEREKARVLCDSKWRKAQMTVSQPLINAARNIQLLMRNLILVPRFPFLNLLNVIQNGNLLLYSKCFLNARFQALKLPEEVFS